MTTRECRSCHISKPLSEFYAHPKSKDGRVHKCKACKRAEVKVNYNKTFEKAREARIKRNKKPEVKARRIEIIRAYRKRHPERVRAQDRLRRAVKSGKVTKLPCEVCGDPNSQGHHHDYTKPLEVQWLCLKHHHSHGHGHKNALR